MGPCRQHYKERWGPRARDTRFAMLLTPHQHTHQLGFALCRREAPPPPLTPRSRRRLLVMATGSSSSSQGAGTCPSPSLISHSLSLSQKSYRSSIEKVLPNLSRLVDPKSKLTLVLEPSSSSFFGRKEIKKCNPSSSLPIRNPKKQIPKSKL
jgi:hypothetical protein